MPSIATILATTAFISALGSAAPASGWPAPASGWSSNGNSNGNSNITVDQPTNASAPETTPTDPNDLISSLILAPLEVDRIALLADSDFVFDFSVGLDAVRNSTTGLGGTAVLANRATFPALIGTGAGMAVGFLGPCGFNTPHSHPRASELNIVVEGSLETAFTQENGARHISRSLNQFQMTVFPLGSMHTEWNPNCEPMVFVAAFSNEDPGTQQTAQTFFGFEDDVITATLGGEIVVNGEDLDAFRNVIPANVALGVESCLAKCNIAKRSVAV